jgi:membrane fusion protein, multidrug efflux system
MTEQILTLPSSLSSSESSKDTLSRVTAERPGPVRALPSPTVAPAPPPGRPAPATKWPSLRRIPIWPLGFVGVIALAAAYVYLPRLYVEETDDAYVQADTVSVVPKVAGYVTALHVTDNSHFKANELLVEIDPRDFEDALRSAEANLQSAQASKANVLEQLSEQSHIIAEAQAAVESDRATLEFAQQDLARYTRLASDGFGTWQRQQLAVSDIGQRKANLKHDFASLAAAQAQVDVLRSQAQQADAVIALAQAAVAQARLNLSYTKIYAIADGSVANRTVQVGTYVQPGQTLFSAVPIEPYIMANFEETQLENLRVGQPVRIRVDAFPNQRFDGRIDSFQRGTGSNFALLPPENATGNFVKVVQRVPVKIILDGPTGTLHSISPGMSVEPTVTIAAPPSWLVPFLSLIGDAPE